MEGTGQVRKEAELVNDETSNVKEEAHQTSNQMDVHYP